MGSTDEKSHKRNNAIVATLQSNRRIIIIALIVLVPLSNYVNEIFSTFQGTPSTITLQTPAHDVQLYQTNLPLFQAVKANNLDKVKELFEQSSTTKDATTITTYDPNAEDPQGITPLIEATLLGNYEMVSYLISKGGLAQPAPGFRHTPLRAACLTANTDLITYLLDNGAYPNAVSDGNRTPLMGACYLRPEYDKLEESGELSWRAVSLMLDAGADFMVKNSFGESALDLCRKRGYLRSVALLEEKVRAQST